MISCPNPNHPETARILSVTGPLKYLEHYLNYGENIPESLIVPKLEYSPTALKVINHLKGATDWKLAISGVPQPIRAELEALLIGVENRSTAIALIARQSGSTDVYGKASYDEEMLPYIVEVAPKPKTPLEIAQKYFSMNVGGFISYAAAPAKIKEIYRNHGYNVEVLTASNGNYYLKINGKRIGGSMYNLDGAVEFPKFRGIQIRDFLAKLGVPIEYVDSIVTPEGLQANAAVSLTEIDGHIQASIRAVFNVSDSVLGEEASHILVAMLRGSPMFAEMMQDIVSKPEYAEVLEEYGELQEYAGDINKLKEEAIAKVIVKILAGVPVEQKEGFVARILRFFKRMFAEASTMDNPYARAANMIINPDTIEQSVLTPAQNENINDQSKNNEQFSDAQIEAMIQSGEITFTDDEGNPCAKMGMKSDKFTKGGKWEMIKEFKGASHERGGIDIEIGNSGIKMSSKQGKFEAKFGLVIAANGLVASGTKPVEPPKNKYQAGTSETLTNLARNMSSYFLGVKNSSLQESTYKPTISKDPNSKYKTYQYLKNDVKRDLMSDTYINNIKTQQDNFKKEKPEYIPNYVKKGNFDSYYNYLNNSPKSGRVSGSSINLGQYKTSAGKDERGEYISIYDKYDWNLFEQLGFKGNSSEIYDRIYKDEWNKINTKK